jgi:hypothetical protein
MLNIIEDVVRFPVAMEKGRAITRTYKTYHYQVYQTSCLIKGSQ